MKLRGNSIARIITVVVLISVPMTAYAQREKRKPSPLESENAVEVSFAAGNSATGIPFELDGNTIIVEARINDSAPLKFIFDTGAGITIINGQLVESMGLKPKDKVKVSGIGGSLGGTLLKEVSLSLSGAKVTNQITATVSFDPFPCEYKNIGGVIGYNFIKEFVVEIDYRSKTISLFDPKSYNYAGRGETLPLMIKRTPFTHAKITVGGLKPVEGLFEIDTGSDGALSVATPFIKKHGLLKAALRQIKSRDRGAGGKSEAVNVRLKSLQLGSFEIDNPVVSFSQATEGVLTDEASDGPLGNEILRRFKVTLDYSRQRMMLEPNESLTAPFEEDMSGLEFETEGAGCKIFKVAIITPNSPASEAGIREGDLIKAIDGKPVESFTSTQIEEMFRREGEQHSLGIERGKRQLQVKLKLRRLI